MTADSYEEIVQGEAVLRRPPGLRHELICRRLHEHVTASLADVTVTRLLPPRSVVELMPGSLLRPDLVLKTTATGKVWLIAEVIDSYDHNADTVTKKALYEDFRLPRLWMVDPRFDNLEVYHGSPYGLSLKQILAQREYLTEPLLPQLRVSIKELFGE